MVNLTKLLSTHKSNLTCYLMSKTSTVRIFGTTYGSFGHWSPDLRMEICTYCIIQYISKFLKFLTRKPSKTLILILVGKIEGKCQILYEIDCFDTF